MPSPQERGPRDISESRKRPDEQARIQDILSLAGTGISVLDVGARDGYISCRLTDTFERVVALDLREPTFRASRVECVAGDVTKLDYPDRHFDAVVCAEVLEHIPPTLLPTACRELSRIARRAIIGVPYRQDTRLDRTRCLTCGARNPPWGHVNSFDEDRLRRLFDGMSLAKTNFIGQTRARTNAISALLMDLAGNPYGTYGQEEPCIHCGSGLRRPPKAGLIGRGFAKASVIIQRAQERLAAPRPNWIHVLFAAEE